MLTKRHAVNKQMAIQAAKGLMDYGMSAAEANVQMVRMMGVLLVNAKIDSATRNALMDAVKSGKLGRLKKDGLKPEAFFHPNSEANAKAARSKLANESIRAMYKVCL
jgi:hypothetical protein